MFNRGISLSKLKILYARITLTPFTTSYFFLAVFTCLALSALQVVIFIDNAKAANMLKPIESLPNLGVPILDNGRLKLCPGLPSKRCVQVFDFQKNLVNRTLVLPNLPTMATSPILNLPPACIVSLKWFDEQLLDNEREDVVTLVFNVYLLGLALITVVNESIPHLFAALLGHVMGAVWAVYRVSAAITLLRSYNNILPLACGGIDLFHRPSQGTSIQKSIPLLIIHVITLIGFSYLSQILFRGYSNQTLSRVGAAPRIHKMYRVALVLLVCLQLANFFSLVSNVLWLSKVCSGIITELSVYNTLYRVAFTLNILIHLPWIIMGWNSVRKESRIQFAICITIAVVILAIATALFASPMYRYFFLTWPFFTTMTCTAYFFLVATTVVSIICRLNFGKGLAHYLHVTQVLAGVDFTPVFFSKTEESQQEKNLSFNEKTAVHFVDLPPPAYHSYSAKAPRSSWMFSAQSGLTVQISTTPPLLSEIGPVPSRLTDKGLDEKQQSGKG